MWAVSAALRASNLPDMIVFAFTQVVDAVLERSSAAAWNEQLRKAGGGLSRQIRRGDRLLAIDDKPCVAVCSVRWLL